MARPAHGLRQELATRQQMLLLPQMLQSLELLALPSTEIETWLGEQAESNEALLLRRAEEPGPLPARSRPGARESGERHEGWLELVPIDLRCLPEEAKNASNLPELARDSGVLAAGGTFVSQSLRRAERREQSKRRRPASYPIEELKKAVQCRRSNRNLLRAQQAERERL